jgi:hypothetical protein
LLTRATVLAVQGRYDEAQRDCARLAPRTTAMVAATCSAGATRNADAAYRVLMEAQPRRSTTPACAHGRSRWRRRSRRGVAMRTRPSSISARR